MVTRYIKDIQTVGELKWIFKYEEYSVTTDDGYILKIFRIPKRTEEPSTSGKKVDFLQHVILDSADCWISDNSSVALAF